MTRTIAEIASAHHGDLEKLKLLTLEAEKSGFDSIKVQVYKVEELLTRSKLKNSKLGQNEFSETKWREYFCWFEDEFRSSKLKIILEPFGLKAFHMVKDMLNFAAFKLPTSDFCDLDFAKELSRKTKHLYMGIGGADRAEISYIINELRKDVHCPRLSLIHGFQAYPTDISDSDLWKINYLKETYEIDVGYACHANAEMTETRNLPSCTAIGAGATFIEKHINVERDEKKSDYYSSLNINEFSNFIKEAKIAFQMVDKHNASEQWLQDNEMIYRNNMKKYACCAKNIEKGVIIQKSDVCMKRVENGNITYDMLEDLIGAKANKNLVKDTAINMDDVQ